MTRTERDSLCLSAHLLMEHPSRIGHIYLPTSEELNTLIHLPADPDSLFLSFLWGLWLASSVVENPFVVGEYLLGSLIFLKVYFSSV